MESGPDLNPGPLRRGLKPHSGFPDGLFPATAFVTDTLRGMSSIVV